MSACLSNRPKGVEQHVTLVVLKSLLVVVLKKIARWGLALGKMSSASNFIFTVSPNFFICDGPNFSFIENCGILRLDPNHFQQLSEISQLLKAQII